MYIYTYIYIYIYIYLYVSMYVYIYICCLKKRRLYETKVSCYLKSSGILFALCSKCHKNIFQNQYIKSASSNGIKNIRIQF